MAEIDLYAMGQAARAAGRRLGLLPVETRNAVLADIARRLDAVGDELWSANAADLAEARAAGTAGPHRPRHPQPQKVAGMAAGCRAVAALPDPLGQVFDGKTLPNGLRLAKKRVPIGVMAVIFESRPNVTTEISALGIKTGNAVIMRGGEESLRTNAILLDGAGRLPAAASPWTPCNSITSPTAPGDAPLRWRTPSTWSSRAAARPAGPDPPDARMPVIYGGIGVCHLFVDETCRPGRLIPSSTTPRPRRPPCATRWIRSWSTARVGRPAPGWWRPERLRREVLGDAPVLGRRWQGAPGGPDRSRPPRRRTMAANFCP